MSETHDTTYERLTAEMMTVETTAERKAIWDRHIEEQRGWQKFLADRNHESYERGLAEDARALAKWEARGPLRFLFPKPNTFGLELAGRYPRPAARFPRHEESK